MVALLEIRSDCSGGRFLLGRLGNDNQRYRENDMDTSRRLGILVFCAVPAIIGGGIVYAIAGSLTPMWIYEVLLAVTAGALVSR